MGRRCFLRTFRLIITYLEESLLILRTLGIQTRSLSPYYLFPATTRFIPTSQIVDIFIHEAFRGFEVRYYLAVVVKGEGEVVVVFPVSFSILFFSFFFIHFSSHFHRKKGCLFAGIFENGTKEFSAEANNGPLFFSSSSPP